MEKSLHSNFYFNRISKDELLNFTSHREGEIKLGEHIADTFNTQKKYIILGINEDIGPQLNGGNKGCISAFKSFLTKFLNIQANCFLDGHSIGIAGSIDLTNQETDYKQIGLMQELDDFVIKILNPYVQQGMIPIVIGGGHNNAYPILKSISENNNIQIAAVNLDAHADFRKTDFRHSGNPFSYAFEENILSKYAVIGLHQSYNNSYIIEQLKANNFFYTWYDEYLYSNKTISSDFNNVINYFENIPFGIELDLDAVAYIPSSASTSSGINVSEARQFISFFAKYNNVKYLHLPEASPQTQEEKHYVGKLLSYLVSDFIKNNLKTEIL